MTSTIQSDDSFNEPTSSTGSASQEIADAKPPHRDSSGGSWLSTTAWVVGFVCLAVVGYGTSTGWFSPRNNQNDIRAGSTSDSFSENSPDGPQAADAFANAPGTTQPPLPPFNPPPLDALAPQESVAILEECSRVVSHLITLMPSSLDALEMQARYEFEFGSVESARSIWNRVLESDPRYVFALRGLGDLETLDGNFREAVKYYRRAVLVEPNNLSHQVKLGVALLAAEEPAEARVILKAVTARDEKYVDAHIELASVLVQLQDFDSALKQFEAALALAPDNAKVHFGLATVYIRLGDKEKAKHHQLEHQRLQVSIRADLRTGRRNYDDASALQIDVAKLYTDIARVYVGGRYVKEAELLLLRVTRTNTKDIESRQALAWLSRVQGKTHDSIRWLLSVAELRPHEFAYAREIVNLYAEANQLDDAGSVLVDFVDRNPKDAEATRAAAQFFLDVQPKLEKAIEYGETSAKLAPTGESFAILSAIYEAAGMLDKASTAIQQAIELEPANATYRQLLALLREQMPTKPQPAGLTKP